MRQEAERVVDRVGDVDVAPVAAVAVVTPGDEQIDLAVVADEVWWSNTRTVPFSTPSSLLLGAPAFAFTELPENDSMTARIW